MGCFTSLSRFLLFALNIACFCIGLAMVAIGIVYLVEIEDFIQHLEEFSTVFSVIPILLIVIGCIVFVIAFLGCCGAIRRSSCLLKSYAITLIVILILQIALVIYTFVQLNDGSTLKDELTQALNNLFGAGNHEASEEAITFIQENLECCGMDGTNSPVTCNGFDQPCPTALYNFIMDSINIVGIVAASVAAVEFIAAILAIWVARS